MESLIRRFGMAARSFPQQMVGKFEGRRALVVGGGRCVWDDLALLGVRGGMENGGWDVICVNDIVEHYPGRIQHLYSNDHRWIPKWLAARRELLVRAYGNAEHNHSCHTGGQYTWPWPGHGTSALNAVYTALALGYAPIVLCGVPLDDSGHYFDAPWVTTNFTREVGLKQNGEMMYWQDAKNNLFRDKVRSMSGRTRELLGCP